MKNMKQMDFPWAHRLSLPEMNKIHFETGEHSEVAQSSRPPGSPHVREA